MSKLVGHLLQTAPFVLAASFVTHQGTAAATPNPVIDELESSDQVAIAPADWQAATPPVPNPDLDLRDPTPVAVDSAPVTFSNVSAFESEGLQAYSPAPTESVEFTETEFTEAEFTDSELTDSEFTEPVAAPKFVEPEFTDPITTAEFAAPEVIAPVETPAFTPSEDSSSSIPAARLNPAPPEAETVESLDELDYDGAIDGIEWIVPATIPAATTSEPTDPPAPPTESLTPSQPDILPLDALELAPMPDFEAPTPDTTLDELETGGSDAAIAQPSVDQLLQEINQYSTENINNSLGQGVIDASQFRDVFPTDWAYTALDDLVRRYDCIKGYPDGSFRGNRALSRYEFAAGLNACVQQIERIIAETTSELATRADLEVMQRLIQEFEPELATISARVDDLEGRVAFLEEHQFSTTTKLNAEVLFAVNGIFPASDDYDIDGNGTTELATDNDAVFQNRVRLNLDTSFTGRDRLRTRLQAGNVTNWSGIYGRDGVTYETRYGFQTNTSNAVEVSTLAYRFPIGEKGTAQVFANSAGMDDFLSPINPFNSSGGGSISRFGQFNPILRVGGQNQGLGLSYQLTDAIEVSAGYTTGDGNNPTVGIFDGSYALGGQVKYASDRVSAALVYLNSYNLSGQGLGHSTGSVASNLISPNHTVSADNFGAELLIRPSDSLFVGGWVGFSKATVNTVGNADVWNFAVTVGLEDVGGDGNLLGFVVGQQPRLLDSNAAVTAAVAGSASGSGDLDIGYHLEAFYRFAVNDRIDITPGVIWLTNPGHNDANNDVIAATIRTRFQF
ncbi:iron uptake porin [Spirulina major CS-329]|uniref:iron uptake porin n=1 Tax=Spirulina TaxID=1154 RepID=UPI0023313DDE|nr:MULTISPECIES: iron uptake porin [Spirulina]MDB9496939.1 iron uptake porin [Spirulina subsalsa CS-330]MDB9501770.1 iron uptake porin [Spirulina major CS-329]